MTGACLSTGVVCFLSPPPAPCKVDNENYDSNVPVGTNFLNIYEERGAWMSSAASDNDNYRDGEEQSTEDGASPSKGSGSSAKVAPA